MRLMTVRPLRRRRLPAPRNLKFTSLAGIHSSLATENSVSFEAETVWWLKSVPDCRNVILRFDYEQYRWRLGDECTR